MFGGESGSVNRVELECQVLCAALRQSRSRQDKDGTANATRELTHLFPDLMPTRAESREPINYYDTLAVRPQAGNNNISTGYLRRIKQLLKEGNPRDNMAACQTVLDAGLVLRKPRLRLSHDLVNATRWLAEEEILPVVAESIAPQLAPPVVPKPAELSGVIGLMEVAQLITKVEIQAMSAQIQLAPNIPIEQLILNAGYATNAELASLHLALDLLEKGKISLAQFQVAMYDERISGLRMAESLQVRGWLDVEVRNSVEEMNRKGS
ncbi:MAG: hypothetical protein K2W82_15315 [Candidatus Obscuribacterales bacterium]|nr:hypothetical protein [Candidatus Obscuribacterales bacterium]